MDTQNGSTTMCLSTGTRTEACACRVCGAGQTPDAKLAANKRDVLALLAFIEGCVENHPSQLGGPASWPRVGDIARVRERLVEIAISFSLRPSGDEEEARRRIEEALCAHDEEVTEALIDAL